MSGSEYLRVKLSLAQAALRDTPPALILDNACVVHAANLMGFWLWGKLPVEGPLDPGVFLGKSVFHAVAESIDRLPLDQNVEGYAKASAIVRRLDSAPGANSSLYIPFIAAMHAEPNRAYLYDHADLHPDREWEYEMSIAAPGETAPGHLLEFTVTSYRLERDLGFLVIYALKPATFQAVETHYARLVEQFGDQVYSLPDDLQPGMPHISPSDLTRAYYPRLVQDPLWYNVKENRATQLLLGQSAVGVHFFEMFFSPALRQAMGPAHETSAPRAVKYFDMFTAQFAREDHDLHEEYTGTMQRLLEIPGFREVRELTHRVPIALHMPEHPGDLFYTCRVLLPFFFAQGMLLQFRNIVRYVYNEPFAQEGRRHYELILIPENYETDIALILLHIKDHAPLPGGGDEAIFKQYLWGLAMVTTIQEGLVGNDRDNRLWDPESAFDGIFAGLEAEYPRAIGVAIGAIIARMRAVIDAIQQAGLLDKQTLLLLLQGITATRSDLHRLTRVLAGEQVAAEVPGKVPEIGTKN